MDIIKNADNALAEDIDGILDAKKEQPAVQEQSDTQEPVAERNDAGVQGGERNTDPAPQEQKVEWWDTAKKELGVEYDTVDDFKNGWEELNGYKARNSDYETKIKEMDDLKQKYNDLREASNPIKFFGSEEKYKQHLIKNKYEGRVNDYALDKLLKSDVTNMSGLDKLLLDTQLSTPGFRGGDKAAKQIVLDELGLDDDTDLSTIDDITHNRLQRKIVDADKNLKEFLKVEIPEAIDFEEARNRSLKERDDRMKVLEESWLPIEDKLIETELDNISLKAGDNKFDFKVDDAFKPTAKAMMHEYFKRAGIDASSPQATQKASEALTWVRNTYIAQNFSKILDQQKKDLETKYADKVHEEQDNPRRGNQSQNVPDREKTDDQKRIDDVNKSLEMTDESFIKLRKRK